MLRKTLISLALAGAAWTPSIHAAERTFTYGLYDKPDSLDAAKMATTIALHPAWLVCEAIIKVSKDGRRLEPGLAESWTASADGLLVTVKLRPGVVFHDGTPLDAEAVKASFERHFRPGHPLYTDKPRNMIEPLLRNIVDQIEVRDPATVVFRLKLPELAYFSQVDVVSPAAAGRLGGANFGRQPVCSGPFKFVSWTEDRLVLEANDRYWGGRPRLDRVVFRLFEGSDAVADAMARGEVDFMPHIVEPDRLERIREVATLIQSPLTLNLTYLGFVTDRPPFTDPAVRRAIVHALNLPGMMLFLGRGSNIPATGPLTPHVRAYDRTARQGAYDPPAAKALLARARYSAQTEVPLVYNESVKIHAQVAAAIQTDLERVGVRVNLDGRQGMGDLLSAIRAQDRGMFINSWSVRGPQPERFLAPLFHSRAHGATNYTRYGNPRLDALLDEARALLDGPRQQALYAQAQRLIVDDAPMVFLYHAPRVSAVSHRVRGLELASSTLPHDKLVNVEVVPAR